MAAIAALVPVGANDYSLEEISVSFRRFIVIVVGSALGSIAPAQGPAVPVPHSPMVDFNALPRPPIPSDPLDPVAGAAQAVQDAEQRLVVTTLLTKARNLSNVRAQPYQMKTSFTSSGGLPSDGSWTLEDISPSRGIYRWTAQGPNYSAVNLYTSTTQGMLYSSQPGAIIPLRLAQVRAAIFFAYPAMGPQASLRTAAGYLDGAAQHCVLTALAFGGQSFSGGRSWQESEYCVDSNTGLLTTYSPVPGLYVHYDYSAAIRFHGKIIPGAFTITEAGRTVIEAKTESVNDPVDSNSALFNPAGLSPLGVGREMTPPSRSGSLIPLNGRFQQTTPGANPVIQVVILHGNVAQDGQLSEVEVLASTDAALNQTARDRAQQRNRMPFAQSQPGATPQSHEMFFTFEFVTSQ